MAAIRELAVLHRWTENDWGATVLELELIAKGLFAMSQAAGLWLRGVGRNGKDTLANIMESHPRQLLVLHRLRLLAPHCRPQQARVQRAQVGTDRRDAPARPPSYFAILFLVYKHLLHDVKMRSIGPVPTSSHNLSVTELKDATTELVQKFIKATTREDIYAELTDVLNANAQLLSEPPLKKKRWSPADLLKSAGFIEKRGKVPVHSRGRRPNLNLLYYRFVDANGVKAKDDAPAHLLPVSAARTSAIASALGAASS